MEAIKSEVKIESYINKYLLNEFINHSYIKYVQLHIFKPQELIVVEEEYPEYLYILLEGEARVSPSSEDGRLALLDYIKPMDLLGDIEYFFSESNYHSVVALTECIFLAIPQESVRIYFKDNLEFYKFLCKNMAQKVRSTSIRYSRALLYPIKNRLAKYIYDLAIFRNTPEAVTIKFSQTAEYLGISPRHFRRILSEFEEEGILMREGTKIHIHDPEKLRSYVTYK